MSAYVISGSQLVALANAIRSKTRSSAMMRPSEMITAVNNFVEESNADIDAMIGRTSHSIDSDTAKQVGAFAFYRHTDLTDANLPAVKSIGSDAFNGCTNLANVTLNSVQSISARAFYGCQALHRLDLSRTSLASIPANCFDGTSLDVIRLPANTFCSIISTSFVGCPLAPGGTGGVIYVPSRFRTRYEANQAWSQIIGSVNNTIISY